MDIDNPKLSANLKQFGFTEADIMEIRETLSKEIKRQNEEENET